MTSGGAVLRPSIQRETLADLRRARVDELLVRHYHEIAHYQDIPLEVDYEVYAAAEAGGKLRIFTVRMGEDLAGYASYFVNHNPHYRKSVQAVQDVLFLKPEFRGFSIGRGLISYADTMLRLEGIQVVYHHSKVKLPMDAVLKACGYELIETVWGRRLDIVG